jgi:hypothetical protein
MASDLVDHRPRVFLGTDPAGIQCSAEASYLRKNPFDSVGSVGRLGDLARRAMETFFLASSDSIFQGDL